MPPMRFTGLAIQLLAAASWLLSTVAWAQAGAALNQPLQGEATASPEPPPNDSDQTLRQQLAKALLDEYVRRAISHSPLLSALRAKHAASREMIQPSGALPDPMVGLMYQSVGPPWDPMAPMSMAQAEVSQVIPGVGKRQARRDAAEAEAAVRHTDLAVTRARIAADVRTLFGQLYAADQGRRALEAAQVMLDLLVAASMGQLVAGRANQETLAKAALERAKLSEQLLDMQTTREVLVSRLNRLLARPEDAAVPRLDALPWVDFETNGAVRSVLERSPELRAQQAAIAAANRRHQSAEAETRPNFLVGLSGGATTNGKPVVTLRLGMELPIWRSSKQEPMIRAARNEIEATEGEYRALELKLRGEVAELTSRLRRDEQAIKLYRDTIIPATTLALHAARDAYATGRGDLAAAIENFRQWLDAEVSLAQREAQRLATWAELDALQQ
jgi:outer membrane protein, heavy metal efflux system